MMRIRPAFTLIEVLVYGALLSIFAVLMFGFVGSMRQQIEQVRMVGAHELTTALALDLMRRDLVSADMQRSIWDPAAGVSTKSVLDEKGRVTQLSVGWQCVKNGIKRYEGNYDFTQRKWLKRATSFYGCSLSDMKFELRLSHDRQYVEQVVIIYSTPKITLMPVSSPQSLIVFQENIRLRNRVLA